MVGKKGVRYYISIHTFLAEGDFTTVAKVKAYNISIHTFLAEGDNFPLADDLGL